MGQLCAYRGECWSWPRLMFVFFGWVFRIVLILGILNVPAFECSMSNSVSASGDMPRNEGTTSVMTTMNINSRILEFARIALGNYQKARYTGPLSDGRNISEQMDDFLTDLQAGKVQWMIMANSQKNTSDPYQAFSSDEVQTSEADKQRCLSSGLLLDLIDGDSQQQELSVSIIAEVCPLLLFQSEGDMRKGCRPIDDANDNKDQLATDAEAWGFGFLSVTIISSCSLGGVLVLPFLSKTAYNTCITIFEGLAVGSLLSSAIFHLLPEAFDLHLFHDTEEYMMRALIVFIGVYVFYIVEHLLRYAFSLKNDKHAMGGISLKAYNSSSQAQLFHGSVSSVSLAEKGSTDKTTDHTSPYNNNNHFSPNINLAVPPMNGSISVYSADPVPTNEKPTDCSKVKKVFSPSKQNGEQKIEMIAWMIIFGDGFHNFIDGVTIGASFKRSVLSGLSISLAIFCEEFPHELGDFAVLLSAGMTVKQAVIYNFLSACTCYAGLVVGIILGDFTSGSPLIFAFSTGMFLYISLVDMMDEINSKLKEAMEGGYREGLKVFLLQNLGLWLGFTLLFLLAYYADNISLDSKA